VSIDLEPLGEGHCIHLAARSTQGLCQLFHSRNSVEFINSGAQDLLLVPACRHNLGRLALKT
jgi:hypothetical protein